MVTQLLNLINLLSKTNKKHKLLYVHDHKELVN